MLGSSTVLTSLSLRVDVGGIPAVDGLSLASTADRVLVLGAARALFEAAAGLRVVTRGEIMVGGREPLDALRARTAAGAPLDPALPGGWTARQYVTWSARLSGLAGASARAMADEALDRLRLGAVGNKKLAAMAVPPRRGVVVAAALATGARVLLVEDPTCALADAVSRPLAHVLVNALADRRTVIFAPRVPLDSPLALAAEEAIVIDGSQVVAQGAPGEIAASDQAFVLRVGGNARAFVEALEARGGRLLGPSSDPARERLTVNLGALRTLDLLRIAQTSDAVVLELRPLGGAFG